MPTSIPRFDLKSKSIIEEQKDKLRQLFPEVFTEDKIDWERLQLTLGANIETGKERFGLTWRGKAECFQIIQEPSIGTLKPAKGESVDWDTTENLFIEGDNLETLKLLQKSYYGKVKLIYIDPPYNTGKEFIYPDKYSESLATYLAYTGQVDAEGRKFSTNTETAGRYHSNWLDMMYPRLFLARNLLRDDGFIVISIDDVELSNLTELLNEIFGEENKIAILIWDRNRKNDAKYFSVGHEYMLVYAKNESFLSQNKIILRAEKKGLEDVHLEFDRLRELHKNDWTKVRKGLKDFFDAMVEDDPRKSLSRFSKVDERGPYRDDGNPSWPGGGGPRYEVLHPITHKPCKIPRSGWRWPNKMRFDEEYSTGHIVFGLDETTIPSVRSNLFEKTTEIMGSVHYSYAQKAAQDFDKIFDGIKVFENPKPYPDLAHLVEYLTDPEDLVMDFFAGSCSLAHGVLELNRSKNSSRKFICIQLPETIDDKKFAGKNALELGLKTIADIGKERIRRVSRNLKNKTTDQRKLIGNDEPQDLGFRVFKLSESNFKVWNGRVPANGNVEKQLEDFIDNLYTDGTDEEILYEILLKSGFALTTPVTEKKIAGKKVYSIDNDTLLICLEHDLTKDLIVKMAEMKPARVICLDAGFKGNDQLRTNALEIMKSHGVADFRTV